MQGNFEEDVLTFMPNWFIIYSMDIGKSPFTPPLLLEIARGGFLRSN